MGEPSPPVVLNVMVPVWQLYVGASSVNEPPVGGSVFEFVTIILKLAVVDTPSLGSAALMVTV
jgi:hypothetical protein